MNGTKITAPAISQAVREFMRDNNAPLENLSVNLLSEKVFTDKREYTVEIFQRQRTEHKSPEIPEEAVEYARETLDKLLSLMYFSKYRIDSLRENNTPVLRISAAEKDGLLIGKNGLNLSSLQYIISMALDARFHRHIPVIIDVDSYREKRGLQLKLLAKSLSERALGEFGEALTDYLPSYERKLIHEELSGSEGLKTFSVGRGPYKKVVVTSLL